jgi:glycosyltransferase involved in cell wall biosynthesis
MSETKPLLSIIIPVLHEEKILDATLSVYTKELRERFSAELVVSDGGSSDKTIEIAKAHADVVLEHKEDRRQTIAEGRHQGALASSGGVLIFINGDTLPADIEQWFTVITDFAKRRGAYERAAALACPVQVAPDERKWMDNVFHSLQNGYTRMLNWFRLGAGRGECQIVRRDVYDRVGGYKVDLAAGEDFDLYARIGLVARVRFASDLIVHESPRRFRKFGYARVLYWWSVNALSVLFTGHSSSDEWEAVR